MEQIRSHVELLSQSEIEMIHNASLRLLERTGMRVPNRTVCRLAQALGARVDEQNMVVRLPRPMMEELLEEVRHNMFCSFGSPNQALIGIGVAQMAAFYGLECGSNAGLTDSIRPDFQCGFEKALSATFSMLAGTQAIGGQGLVGADQGMSFAQLVLDNEWIDAFNYVTRGIEVDEDSIGLETIEEVGIGGNFLGEEHTVMYMRESSWAGTLFDRDSFDNLTARGTDLLEKADARARELIAQNRTDEPIVSPEIARTLDELAADAVKELAP